MRLFLKTGLTVQMSLLYVFFASLMAMACVLLTPPGQTPDERNHFARLTQISQGGFVAIKKGTKDAGGYLPTGIPAESELLNSLRFNPQAKVSSEELLALSERHWSREKTWVSFPNTAIYAPITYLPGALAAFVARHTRATILQTSYAVRTINVICAIALCALGMALARRGALYLAVLSSFPMVVALGASCSQDGILIGLAIVTAALLTRLDTINPGSSRFWLGMASLFAILAVSKPPLLLCSLIPLGYMARAHRWRYVLPFAVSVLAFLFWQKFGLNPAKIQFLDGSGTSDSGQVHWVLTHPATLPALALHTLQSHIRHNIHEFFGVLGWLDTVFPNWFYRIFYIAITASCCFCIYPAVHHKSARQSGRVVFLAVFAVLLAIGAVYFSLYVIWTPVGAPVIDGVQGRYFLPIAPFLALIFPKVSVEGQVASSLRTHQIAMLAMGLFLAIDMVTLTCVLASRYWLA
ncbi:DUF2142 domain-containing protein [Asaia spathodeae]|uniref:DUF2142 domain-containing protein n=1 Tax=Asaia spathodeae TaxID=657016 RepID=A0ABX2P229_9PROT|nr:DUF2142 domain-containing protein [Asaia spathodeae]GBR13471.1 hypothetical protein AA105894_0831 [Asaia spathodeae NBRC 105894]